MRVKRPPDAIAAELDAPERIFPQRCGERRRRIGGGGVPWNGARGTSESGKRPVAGKKK